ncbi:MAG: DMT family transporter [Lachnospiraceae bacterium]|nr:DMT family transporter [Lachnospiraceae bacterium]
MKKNGLFNIVVLLLCAMIWGFAFSAQSVGAQYVGPWTFLAARAWLGVATLIVFISVRKIIINCTEEGKRAFSDAKLEGRTSDKGWKLLFLAGGATGTFLCFASVVQQAGIAYTSVAKSSFITAMYVVIVPILSLLLGRKPGAKIWAAVALSVTGLYLLSFSGGIEAVNIGDMMMVACAFLFALQIICINHFVDRLDGLMLSCFEFLSEAIIASIGMLLFEHPEAAALKAALVAILYAGIMSNGVAYTLQIIGQRNFDPTIASLCMCMESVFGALGGFLLLGQTLTVKEICGCALMFMAILVAEVPVNAFIKKKKQKEETNESL